MKCHTDSRGEVLGRKAQDGEGEARPDSARTRAPAAGFRNDADSISRWENGQSPRRYIIAALAEELGVAVAELFEADEDEEDMNAPLTRAVLRQVISDEIRSALKERSR